MSFIDRTAFHHFLQQHKSLIDIACLHDGGRHKRLSSCCNQMLDGRWVMLAILMLVGFLPSLHHARHDTPLYGRPELRHNAVQSQQLSVLSTQEMLRSRNVTRRYTHTHTHTHTYIYIYIYSDSDITESAVRLGIGLLAHVLSQYVQCVHCYKGDAASQWEMAILGCQNSVTPEPIN